MDIVFEDKDKIIVNKPAGQLTQSGRNFDLDLVSEVMNYQKSRKESIMKCRCSLAPGMTHR